MYELGFLVKEAEELCIEAHKGVFRRVSGKPYHTHPFEMRKKARELGYDNSFLEIIILLHDVFEMKKYFLFEKSDRFFGMRASFAIYALDRTNKSLFEYWKGIYTHDDWVVPLVKSLDVWHNSQDYDILNWYTIQERKTFGLPLQKKTDSRLYDETFPLLDLAEKKNLNEINIKSVKKIYFQEEAEEFAFLKDF